jgi:hypothetical protein
MFWAWGRRSCSIRLTVLATTQKICNICSRHARARSKTPAQGKQSQSHGFGDSEGLKKGPGRQRGTQCSSLDEPIFRKH